MKKLLFLLVPFLWAGCVVHTNPEIPVADQEVPDEVSYIVDDLKSRNFELESDLEEDDEIDIRTVTAWIDAELNNQEDYSIITFKSSKEAEAAFKNIKAHEQLDSDDEISEQDGIFIQTDIEDGSVEAMILHDNQIVIGEREDGNLDLLIQQFTDWKLK